MLEVDGIDVYHGEIQALWQVSFKVEAGELVALIGANGAGKSTIVESISGLLPLAGGRIRFDGTDLGNEPSHRIVERGVSLIPEERGIFPGMSVLENLELGAFTHRSRNKIQETLRFVYDLFPILKNRLDQKAGTMSGGEQQMLAIARALMAKPTLLMCDEPSLGLAPMIVKQIFNVIKQINQAGVSVLLVEQNVNAALNLSQRAYIIENGRVTGGGQSQSLLEDKKVRDAYLGTV